MPKISVILPVYNGEAYLAESIESVLNQTYRDLELIIVNDCSTDHSLEIANKYVQLDPRVTCISNKENLKLPQSLNEGFSHATGEYWTWTSCDNLYLSNALEEMLQEIESSQGVGLVYASMQIINDAGENEGFIEAGSPEDLIFRNVVGACFLYRRSVANEAGLYDKNLFLCEDYEYWLRISLISGLKSTSKKLYQYRRHTKSLSYNNEKEIIEKGIEVQKKYYPFFVKTRKQASQYYAFLRARDIYNPLRQLYLFYVLFYSPTIFFKEFCGLIKRRFKKPG